MGAARLQADILAVIVQAAFWTSLAFIPAASLIWPWWRTPLGRALVSMDVLIVLAFLPAVLRRVAGIPASSAGFAWFNLGVLALVPLRTVWLAVIIWRIQRGGRAVG